MTPVAEAALPEALAEATRHQPRAGATLAAALATGPSHAYLFRGPPGSGKAAAARAFAAELLALGAPDPDDARRRAMLDPSPHPDLVWLRPPGGQHLVDDVRDSVIHAANLRPAEGEHRVFVIADAEDLRDESQNALLKTLEEPGAFAHLILLCAEPEQLADTILSRCATVEFAPLSPEAVLEAIEPIKAAGDEAEAVARLCGGDLELARFLLTDRGRSIRAAAESAARAARAEPEGREPWRELLDSAEEAGADAGAEEERRLLEDAQAGGRRGRSGKLTREATEQVKRDRAPGADAGARPRPRALLRLVPRPGGRRLGSRSARSQHRPAGRARRRRRGPRPGRGPGSARVGAGPAAPNDRQRLGGARPRGALAEARGGAPTLIAGVARAGLRPRGPPCVKKSSRWRALGRAVRRVADGSGCGCGSVLPSRASP